MKPRKVRYFDRFFTQYELFAEALSHEFFDNQPQDLSWYHAKLLLRHKDCSHSFRMRYVENGLWYQRLTACLAKPARSKYAVLAMQDRDVRVVRAAIYGSIPAEVITSVEAANLVAEHIVNRGLNNPRIAESFQYAANFLDEHKLAMKSPALGLLSPNEDIRRITKEMLDDNILPKM